MSALVLLILTHGAYPLAYQLHEEPGAPTHLVAGTTFGLLLSNDDGHEWKWVCEEAIGYGTSLSPTWYVTSTGGLIGGSFRGLFISNDHGCTWSSDPTFGELPDAGQGTGVSDLHSNGTALFAASSKYGVTNRVWRSMNEGVSFSETAIASNGEFYTTIRSAPSRPQRVYVAAWWFRPSPTEYLYVSDNGGDTFTRTDISALMPTVPVSFDGGSGLARGSFYVYAVDPTNPDVVYGGLQQDDDPQHSFIIKTVDQGAHWSQLVDTQDQLSSVALSDDGNTVWVATSNRLLRSTNGGASFATLSVPTRNSCVARNGDRLYACGWPEFDMFALARSDGGTGFTPLLTWPQVTGVPACSPTSLVTTQCAGFYPALVATFPKVDPDGGTGGGSGGAGGGTGGSGGGDPPGGVCHCTASGAEVSLTLWLLLGRLCRPHALRRRRVQR